MRPLLPLITICSLLLCCTTAESRYKPATNVHLNEVLVINLDRSPERLAYMTAQLNQAGVPFTRIRAVDGKKDIDLANLRKKGIFQYWPEHSLYDLSAGEVGNYLSHRNSWIRAAKNPSATLILEDDTIISPQLITQLRPVLETIPQDWDMVYLGCHATDWYGCLPSRLDSVASGKFSVVDSICIAGNYAYLVSPQGAKKLVKNSLPIVDASDFVTKRHLISQRTGPFNAYCANPELISVNYDLGSIITEYGRPPNE